MVMKYLKKFESLFGESEPELFFDRNLPRSERNDVNMYNHYTQNREAWTKKELDELKEMVESSPKVGTLGLQNVHNEPDMKIFYFVLSAGEGFDLGTEIYCHKCMDEVYLVQEFELETYDRRYFCDGFDTLKKLIGKYL